MARWFKFRGIKSTRSVSTRLRQNIINLRFYHGKSVEKIARRFGLHENTIRKYCNLFLVYGDTYSDGEVFKRKHGRRRYNKYRTRILRFNLDDIIEDLYSRKRDAYLWEYQREILTKRWIKISLSSINRYLISQDITVKRITGYSKRVNLYNKLQFLKGFNKICTNFRQPVWGDEGSFNDEVGNRLCGRSERGELCEMFIQWVDTFRWTLILTMNIFGGFKWLPVRDSCDGDTFCIFLERYLLPHMNPYPGDNSILLLDNASIHHVDKVSELCDKHGVVLMYLEPYCPDTNPCENMFGIIKQRMQENRITTNYECYKALCQYPAEVKGHWLSRVKNMGYKC